MNSSSLHTSPGRLHSSHRERHPNRSVIADADGDRVQHEPVHDLRDVAPAPPAQDVVRRHEVVQPQPAIHRSVPNALAPVREPPGRVRVEVSEGRSIRAIVGLEFKGVRIGVHHANGVVWGPVSRTRLNVSDIPGGVPAVANSSPNAARSSGVVPALFFTCGAPTL
eukprot:31466-Pelagococcus_subviridis.AAC.6